MEGGLHVRMVGLEVTSASALLYFERFVIIFKLVVSYCDYENYGNPS